MEHGKVTSVKYKNGVVYCDVRPIRVGTVYTKIPVMKPHSGFIQVPKQGDSVTMEKLNDGTRFISNVLGGETANPDNLKEGELTIQLDNGTKVQFERKKSGDYDLNLTASGQVKIQGIPFMEHVHPYTDDEIEDTGDGSGSETVQDKETDTPK